MSKSTNKRKKDPARVLYTRLKKTLEVGTYGVLQGIAYELLSKQDEGTVERCIEFIEAKEQAVTSRIDKLYKEQSGYRYYKDVLISWVDHLNGLD